MTQPSHEKVALVVTSIAPPNENLERLARGCLENGFAFIVIGDEASPRNFSLDGCRFYGLEEQRDSGFKLASLLPTRHYTRKNLGYLVAMRHGATIILETDDDNIPHDAFWRARSRHQHIRTIAGAGWVNVYKYFSESDIWPRGFPLDRVRDSVPSFESLPTEDADCPIQQGLSNDDPDVDAIYRLVGKLPQSFRNDRRIALKSGSWCPFNSQNTAWWKAAFALLYLPSYCSFRMTDIWRSFVAQRCAWANDWAVLFHEPNGRQERNEHDLLRNFADEVPGYLHNSAICEQLSGLELAMGEDRIGDNVRTCYQKLIEMKVIPARELDLVDAWIADVSAEQETAAATK